jgi:Thiamine pyrophosphate enzyme, C-terminal TPP binding domain
MGSVSTINWMMTAYHPERKIIQNNLNPEMLGSNFQNALMGGSDSRIIIPRSHGGLGYAVPALVGAHLARPGARLVGLFGDGSLGLTQK